MNKDDLLETFEYHQFERQFRNEETMAIVLQTIENLIAAGLSWPDGRSIEIDDERSNFEVYKYYVTRLYLRARFKQAVGWINGFSVVERLEEKYRDALDRAWRCGYDELSITIEQGMEKVKCLAKDQRPLTVFSDRV